MDDDKKAFLFNDFDRLLPLRKAVRAVREQLLELKLEWNGIVFVVDELDRCLPEYAVNVLERLHHIRFDTESDKNRFIQLIALNKKEIIGSIIKAFGKRFGYEANVKLDQNTSINGMNSNSTVNASGNANGFIKDGAYKKDRIVLPITISKSLSRWKR